MCENVSMRCLSTEEVGMLVLVVETDTVHLSNLVECASRKLLVWQPLLTLTRGILHLAAMHDFLNLPLAHLLATNGALWLCAQLYCLGSVSRRADVV